MKVSQNAHVVLSLGPQNVTTPSLVGESLRVARIQLLQVGPATGRSDHVRGSRRAVRHRFAADPAHRERGRQVLASICSWRKEIRRLLTSCRGWWACPCRTRIGCSLPPGSSCPKTTLRSLPAVAEGRGHGANARAGLQNNERISHRDGCGAVGISELGQA